jgi:hypothetical protein
MTFSWLHSQRAIFRLKWYYFCFAESLVIHLYENKNGLKALTYAICCVNFQSKVHSSSVLNYLFVLFLFEEGFIYWGYKDEYFQSSNPV